ncbi:tyrosine-type recombinase/integrase [Candidatus Parcubacteria bacterium]|nr:tyrosine-type recombinase/integrase [Patescibacteria group bacterium]MBU4309685.1 tyrosine-type recombinase/integrase [Patescibacteria group bacterium]MBU4431691.1 tyrosine-type recombinase/integrase [Patescibacteria group bacterium]MBU4577927.1 tyrosine-type recombinase/integrase [Patescibacteria group bacterium]MCG2696563.1 tyrosine-type recombinase/integrase [Candidatus Parcubacteria bacterium]
MSVRKFRKRWYIDIYYNNKRIRKPSPENSRAGARAYEAYALQQLSRGVDPFEAEKIKKVILFSDFAWKWVELYAKTNNKVSGVRGKTSVLKTHLVPFFGKCKLNEITNFLVEEYKALALKKGLCNKTVNNHLTILNTCLTHAVEWDELETPPRIKRLSVPQQKFDFMTFEESEMLINQADGYLQEMILFALHTGMRYGELRAISWQHINWDNKLLAVKGAFYRDILGSTKSNKERHIPLSPRLYSVLAKRKKTRGFIFADSNGDYLKENLARQALKRLIAKTELNRDNGRKIGWHALRHTFASQLAMRGAPLSAIQQLLGHSDIQTTMKYAHLSPSTLRSTIKLLENGNENGFGHHLVNTPVLKPEFQEIMCALDVNSTANLKTKTESCDSALYGGDGGS